ncbi:MAG TPA: hypothetical protein VMU54_13425 [Planctomycetota bacterium]|nr:hypothetical protein [Planctomycetota bacterium]
MFNRWKGEELIDKAHDVWKDSGEFARTGASQANSFIHRRPLAATLLSVGAGICCGVFFGSLGRTVERGTRQPRSRARTRATTSSRR